MAFDVEVEPSGFIYFLSVDITPVGCESFKEWLSCFPNVYPLRAFLTFYFVDDICSYAIDRVTDVINFPCFVAFVVFYAILW